jgi:hypothetical protein
MIIRFVSILVCIIVLMFCVPILVGAEDVGGSVSVSSVNGSLATADTNNNSTNRVIAPSNVNLNSDTGASNTSQNSASQNILGDISSGFSSLTQSFTSGITELPHKIVYEFITKPAMETNQAILESIKETMNYLDSGMKFDMSRFTAIITVYNNLKPFALSFVALFFVIELGKIMIYLESFSLEVVISPLLKMVIAQALVNKGLYLLTSINVANNSMIDSIGNNLVTVIDKLVFSVTHSNSTGISFSDLSLTGNLILLVIFILFLISECFIVIILIIRAFDLAMMTAISPLFFSCVMSDSTSTIFISFLKNYFAVLLQALSIIIACYFYTDIIGGVITGNTNRTIVTGFNGSGIGGGVFEAILSMIAFTVYIVMSGSSLKGILGVGNGGGFVRSVASVATRFI